MSKVYTEEQDTSWAATPTTQLLRQLHAQGETARWIAAITTPAGEVVRIAVGDPVRDNTSSCLFLPPWFCMHAGLIGDGGDPNIAVRFERCVDLPRATELTMQILGDIPEDFSVRDVLEDPLSQLGVLQEEMILPIPCLDGHAHLRVKATKPAACVFLDGQNVALCFEQHETPTNAQSRTATPMPTPFFSPTDIGAPMIPSMSLSGQTGTTSNNRSVFGGLGRRLNE